MNLLKHLAPFYPQQENLATEALCYLLTKSETCAAELIRMATGKPIVEEPLHFQTQVAGEKGTIPDLVGRDVSGRERILVEAKFWAGLTDNQPVNYLARLSTAGSGALLFVMPEKRLDILEPEILKRCESAGIAFTRYENGYSGTIRYFSVGCHLLALVSWKQLLGRLRQAVTDSGQYAFASDIEQLDCFCGSFDDPAFQPLTSDDLAPVHAHRFMKLKSLVDAVTEGLKKDGLATTDGMRATPLQSGYCRYMKIRSWCCDIRLDYDRWSSLVETPLWLATTGKEWHTNSAWDESMEVNQALRGWLNSQPKKAFHEPGKRRWFIPLHVPIGMELERVVQELVKQVKEFYNLIPDSGTNRGT